jgi:hypothetical protein
VAIRPYRLGLEPKFLEGTGTYGTPQRASLNSFLEKTANPDSFNRFSGLPPHPIRLMNRCYSAAATNASLVVAADNMKSEIRGTISERNREPLNTP